MTPIFRSAGSPGKFRPLIRIALSALPLAVLFFGVSGLGFPPPSAEADEAEAVPVVESGSTGSWEAAPESFEDTLVPSPDPAMEETASGTGGPPIESEAAEPDTLENTASDMSETMPAEIPLPAPLAPDSESPALDDLGAVPDPGAPARSLMLMSNPMVPRDGLLVEMLFDGNAQDTSGLGNNPSVVAINTYDPSRFRQSASLPVANGLRFNNSTTLPINNNLNFTLAVWIRASAMEPPMRLSTFKLPFLTHLFSRIDGSYSSNPNRLLDLYFDKDGNICHFQFISDTICSNGENYLDQRWHLVIIRARQWVGREIYVDGVLKATGIAPTQTAAQWMVLYNGNGSTFYKSDVRVDNFRYYGRALGDEEIESLWLEYFNESCSDEILNQNETETDYGGNCGKRPSAGRIGEYRFDWNASDDSGLAHNLNPLAKVAYGSWFQGLGLSFTGAYIRNPDLASSALSFGTGMSIAFWVDTKSLEVNNNKMWTLFHRSGDSTRHLWMYLTRFPENQIILRFSAWAGFTSSISYIIPADIRWHHLAGTFDGTRTYLFVNGERQSNSYPETNYPPFSASFFNSSSLIFGYNLWQGSPQYPLKANIDEVTVYDRALSADEMSRLYRSYTIPDTYLAVSSSTPSSGSSDVPRLSPLRLSFSASLDPATVADNVSLQIGSAQVPVTVSLDGDRSVVLRPIPVQLLAANTNYQVLVGTGLASAGGDRLAAPVNIAFSTGDRLMELGFQWLPLREALRGSVEDWDEWEASQRENAEIAMSREQANIQGDPVDLRTGEFTYENTVLRLPGIGLPYELGIHYRSQVVSSGLLGDGWKTSYERRLVERADGSVAYFDERFGEHVFMSEGSGAYAYLPSYKARLSKTATGFDLAFDDRRSMAFTLSGNLARIADPSGNALAFSYDSEGRMATATDTLGKAIAYAYGASGRLSSVTASGGSVEFSYFDGTGTGGLAGDLSMVKIRRGSSEKILSFGYSSDISAPLLDHNLARLTDSAGHVYVENAYDADDRVTSQKYGTGTISYEYSLGDLHADDTPAAAGSGAVTGHYVAVNRGTDRRGNAVEHAYDRFGNLVSRSVYDPADPENPVITTYAYDDNHRLVSETLPLGNGTKYAYDERWNRTQTRHKADMAAQDDDAADLVERREYDPASDRLLQSTAPDGTVTEYSYDQQFRLTQRTIRWVRLDADSATGSDLRTSYEYDTAGQLIRTVDPAGHAVSIGYQAGRPVSVAREGSGASLTQTYAYDERWNPVSATDAAGYTRTMSYDDYDRLVASVSAEGVVRNIVYDANDNITLESMSSGTGAASTIAKFYDALDLPVTVTESISADVSTSTHITYDANGNVASVTLPNGIEKRYEYDASDRPVKISTHPSHSGADLETRYEYDANGNMVREVDAAWAATVHAYDGFGRISRTTDALGNTREYSYDRLGNVTRSMAKNASWSALSDTRAEWNSIGNLLVSSSVSGGSSLETRFAYDAAGNLLRRTDPAGNVTRYEYDSFGRLSRVIDAEWISVITEYDARSLPVARTVTGSGGKSVSAYFAYDGDGRLAKTWRTLSGSELATLYEYDGMGNVTREIQPDGGQTVYEYDLAGRLLREIRTASGVSSATSSSYDLAGNPLSVTDPGGAVTRYEYDGFGRLSREILPDGSVTQYSYDAMGRVATVRDPAGSLVSNTYDALGRLARRDIAAGSGVLGVAWETYSYDALGRLFGANDSLGQTLSFVYDGHGRLASESSSGRTVGYAYDPAGYLSSLSYPGGSGVSIQRDRAGRLLSLSSPARQYARYSYSGAELSGIAYGNGARTDLAYDPLSRLASLSHFSATGGIIAETYAYDDEDKLLSDGWETYSYDGLDRLHRAVDSVEYDPAKRQTTSRGNEYGYDPAGNRVSLDRFAHVERLVSVCKTVKVNGVNTRVCEDENRVSESAYVLNSYDANTLNQYDGSVRHPDMANRDETAYGYDANGNMVSDGTYLYGYDYRNRLVRVTRASDNRILKEITYDVLGRKTGWKSNSTSVLLVYAGDQMIEEYSRLHSNPYALVASYVWGERNSDDAVAMIRGNQVYYYQADRLGSVLALTNSSGAVVERYSYDAYGTPSIWSDELGRFRSMGDSAVGNTLLYTGRPYDRIIGLYDMRARQYSPTLGRFISRDPIGMKDGTNLYTYSKNSPINYTDRNGTSAKAALPSSWVGTVKVWEALIRLNPVPIEDLKQLDADEVAIYGTTPFMVGSTKIRVPAHTEIVFFKDGLPVATLWSAPIWGWTFQQSPESAALYVKNGMQISENSTNVEGCISALEESPYSNSIVTLYGKATICWAGAIECYLGTKE